MFRGIVKGTGYPLHSPVSASFPLPASPCAITFQLESTLDFVTLKFQAISPHQAGPTASSADSSTGLKPCTALYYVTTLRNQSIGEEMCKKNGIANLLSPASQVKLEVRYNPGSTIFRGKG